MDIKQIGIVGAGLMGGGIAQMFAERGYDVVLWDVTPELLDKGLGAIAKRLAKSAEKGSLTSEQAAAVLGRIRKADAFGAFKDADLVIEAVTEDLEIKRALFRELERAVSAEAVLATNTSSLRVGAISEGLATADRVMGIHFFNPPTKLELVEVVPAQDTRPELLSGVCDFLRACRKTPVTVKDSPGYIVNRLLLLLINEAANMVDEGVASAQDIDTAMRLGALHPAGPLAVADLIGLDTCKKILDVLHAETGKGAYKAAASISGQVSEGRLGRKTNKGFFTYGA